MGTPRPIFASLAALVALVAGANPTLAASASPSAPASLSLTSSPVLTAPNFSRSGDSQLDLAFTKTNPISSETVSLLVQGPAASDPAFLKLKSKLISVGNGLWRGEVTRAEYLSIRQIRGLRASKLQQMALEPMAPAGRGLKAPARGKPAAVASSSALNRSASNQFGKAPDAMRPSGSSLGNEIQNTVSARDAFPGLAAARTSVGTTGAGVVVAVIDSGIDSNALGMSGKVILRRDLSTPTGSCTDRGYLDPYGHGTHVASMIGASDSGSTGGVAPGTTFVDLRIFNCAGQGDSGAVDSQLSWLIANHASYGIKVVNMSLGMNGGPQDGTDSTSVLVNQLVAAGVFVSVAAGNNTVASSINSPGTAPYATTVAAAGVSSAGRFLAPFSSMGPTSDGRSGVDVTAAGVSILASASTALGVGSTLIESGTSMAAPFTAGVAALLMAKYPSLSIGGTACAVGDVGCSSWGVVTASMVNQVQDAFKTQDWFSNGMDAASGLGLLDPVATLKNTTPAAASIAETTLKTGQDNYIFVPPSVGSVELNLLLDAPIRTGIWDSSDLNLTGFRPDGTPFLFDGPCVTLGAACYYGLSWNTFTPTNYTLGISDNSSGAWIRVQTQRQVNAVVNIATTTQAAPVSGVSVESVRADSGGSATLTITRTRAAGSATTFAVSATNGWVPASSSVVVAAGPAGTSATVILTAPDQTSFGEALVSAPNEFAVAALWPQLLTGDGAPYNFLGAPSFVSSAIDSWSRVVYSSNGSLIGTTWDPRITSNIGGQSISGLVYAPAGSSTLTKFEIPGAAGGQIDAYNFSDDGSMLLMGEYPAAYGVVPGDGDTVYQHFVHNMIDGTNLAVGPERTPGLWDWDANGNSKLSADGTSVVIGSFADANFVEEKFVWQGGLNFGTRISLGNFTQASGPKVLEVTSSSVAMSYYDTVSASMKLVRFAISGATATPTTSDLGIQPISNDAAIAGQTGGLGIQCILGATTSNFSAGKTIWRLAAVAPDCGSVVVEEEVSSSYPRGRTGSQLVRIYANGSHQLLDANTNAYQTWYVNNSDSSDYLTAGPAPKNAADINGINDYMPGLSKPALTGSPAVGSPIGVDVGSWGSGATLGYQWFRDGDLLSGAIGATYSPVAGDVGHAISVQVTATRGGSAPQTRMSSPTTIAGIGFFFSATPVMSHNYPTSNVLTATFGSWDSNATLSYGRYRNGILTSGTSGSMSYTITGADSGATITFRVTGSAAGFPTLTKVSNSLTPPATGVLTLTPTPTISGTTRVGQTLRASSGTWDSGVTLSYQWKNAGVDIANATAATYVLQGSDLGKAITVSVTGSKLGFVSVTKTSRSVTPTAGTLVLQPTPTISGVTTVGQRLTANPGTWDVGVTLTYQWLRNGSTISGANGSSYLLVVGDRTKRISVRVTASKPGYTSVIKTSASTSSIK